HERPEDQSQPGAEQHVLEQVVQHTVPSAAPRRTVPASRERAYGAGGTRHNGLPQLARPVSRFTRGSPARGPGRGDARRGAVTSGGPRRGRRDNGLIAAVYAAAGDVDPRVGEHLLDV